MIFTSQSRGPVTTDWSAQDSTPKRVNLLLEAARGSYSPYDSHFYAVETLIQLARIWADWQSPSMGTFPMDYRDPSGPVDLEVSKETGEDELYWIMQAELFYLAGSAHLHDAYIQAMIQHAVAVMARVLALTKEDS